MRPPRDLLLLSALLLGVSAACARRADQDFEFEDAHEDAERSQSARGAGLSARRPRRYVYEPHNPLCRALVCQPRELCLLRDAFTALCADNEEVLRQGDAIVPAGVGAREDDDDVFYDASAPAADAPDRCVGCGGGARSGGFLCGSDNRTYSSLCRLDLHNCVRRGAPPVAPACRGFCPCGRARPAEWRRRKSEAQAHNEVLPERASRRKLSQGAGCALDKMADRLLDWFSVLMRGERAPARGAFPPGCKPEVRWMFAHLDADGDGALDAAELYALRHDERERCLRPFLASCGGGARVRRGAWCACLARAARPCTALARAQARAGAAGGYVPACDARGYYRARQCHAALGVCWCVDAHGAERAGSRVRGEPRCGPGAGAPQDDEDGAGSGDAEPRP